MTFTIRLSQKRDMPEVLRLVQELAIYEKEGDAVEVTVDDLVRDGFGDRKLFHCFIGEADGKIVGMALIYERYSTWKGPVIHLEDLIVTKRMRGSGLGSALLAEVVKYGRRLGVKRICWEVLDWNEPAIKFYESKGANVMRDWDIVQLDETGIKNFF